jgi:hypothetical protein
MVATATPAPPTRNAVNPMESKLANRAPFAGACGTASLETL